MRRGKKPDGLKLRNRKKKQTEEKNWKRWNECVGMCRCEVKIDQLCNQHSLSAQHIFALQFLFIQIVGAFFSFHARIFFFSRHLIGNRGVATDWMKLKISSSNAIGLPVLLAIFNAKGAWSWFLSKVSKIAWHQIIYYKIFYSLK